MSHRLMFLFALPLCATFASAQSNAGAQDITLQVSPAQGWIDSGLELKAGDLVKISASKASSTSGACNPAGQGAAANSAGVPLPAASEGALLARLQSGSVPILVGAEHELKILEPSHLFLGMNFSGKASCQGAITAKIHKSSDPASANSQPVPQKTRGEELKSQLGNAAQVFMQGQFGMGKSTPESNAAPSTASAGTEATASAAPLKVSETSLDPDLRKQLDTLPRRVNDQFQNLGDMVNFVIIGSQKDVQAALEAATWHVADTNNTLAALNAAVQTYGNKDYLAMPMSTLFLFGRKQDFGYEMAEPIAMVASRHHFRIWKAPFTWKDHEVWVGAGTHDIGFAKDRRNNNVTHKIDPAVDGERDNIGRSLQKTNKAKSMAYYLPPNPVQEAKNATGDGYRSDGRLLVVFLQ